MQWRGTDGIEVGGIDKVYNAQRTVKIYMAPQTITTQLIFDVCAGITMSGELRYQDVCL